jgi:predicted ATPase
VAESPWESGLNAQILLYFVERQGSESKFNPVEINPYGAIPAWPDGFFDQGPLESESIMDAAERKRMSRPKAR